MWIGALLAVLYENSRRDVCHLLLSFINNRVTMSRARNHGSSTFSLCMLIKGFTQLSCTSAEETGGFTRKTNVWRSKRFKVENLFLLYLRTGSVSFYALFVPVFINAADFLLTPVLVSLCSMSLLKLWFHFLFIKGSVWPRLHQPAFGSTKLLCHPATSF